MVNSVFCRIGNHLFHEIDVDYVVGSFEKHLAIRMAKPAGQTCNTLGMKYQHLTMPLKFLAGLGKQPPGMQINAFAYLGSVSVEAISNNVNRCCTCE